MDKENNFLYGFLKLQQETEIPELFAVWCGISAVSASLGRRVWLNMGHYVIFPNFYVVLVAGSGRCRKSTAISQAEYFIRGLNPPMNIIAQKITPEAFIDAMRLKETADAKKILSEKSEGFVLVDELSTFLNKTSYEAGLASLLIEFYDCKASFEYHTKGGGSQKVTNACLGLLGASTVDWITNAIPESAVGGGLTSRIVFVFVEEPAPPVAITTYSDEKRQLTEVVQQLLQRVSQISGQVTLSDEAWAFYKEEYERYSLDPENNFFANKTLSGYASRRNMHLLKLGIVLSACERTDLLVTATHLHGAKSLLEQCELNMPRVLSLITSSEQGALVQAIESIISRAGKISKSDLLRAMAHKIGNRELDGLMETLTHTNKVRVIMQGSPSVMYYVWIEPKKEREKKR